MMQYHLDGFTPGDPALRRAAHGLRQPESSDLYEEVDVLIVGCGHRPDVGSAALHVSRDHHKGC